VLGLCATVLGAGSRAAAATAPVVKERSVGSPTDGHLIGGARIEESPALRRYPCYGDDDVRYGLSSLVGAIERAAREVHRHFPDAVLSVGHLSRHGGGEVDRHASHESGRDADVGFYVKGVTGKPLLGDRMVAFQGDGTASSWPGAHFDDARNWAFVAALLGDGHVHVSHLFIASPLRARLLAFAARSGSPQGLRNHAAEVLMQPHGALPHDDHFHVRISCPPGMTGCIEFPTRPRSRKVAPARGGKGAGGAGPAHSKPPTTELTPPPRARPGHDKPPADTEDEDPAAPSIDLPVPMVPPDAPGAPGAPGAPPGAAPGKPPPFVPPPGDVDDVDGVLD
jgi:penicillin-insensitive murein endopeptidase